MNGATDDTNLNNLGPGGTNDAGEAAFRQRVNRDVGDALESVNFRSRRSAIMAQIRAEQPGSTNTPITPLAQLDTVPAAPPKLNVVREDRPDNVRDFTQSRALPRRNFSIPSWAGAMAAVMVILLVAGLALLLLNNQNSTIAPQSANVPTVFNAVGSSAKNAGATTIAAAATTTTNAASTTNISAAATTTAAATTQIAMAAANTKGATTAAMTTVVPAAAMTTSAAAATTAAATTTAAAGASSSDGATTTSAAASIDQPPPADQSNIPLTIINGLPTYPDSTKLNLDNSMARAVLIRLLQVATGNVNQNLSSNRLVLLNAYKVKGTDLPQWYANLLKDQNFKLTAQNSAEASSEPGNSSLDWRVFTSTIDPKQMLTYFFLNVKNSTVINDLLGTNKVADGDTIILVFGSRQS